MNRAYDRLLFISFLKRVCFYAYGSHQLARLIWMRGFDVRKYICTCCHDYGCAFCPFAKSRTTTTIRSTRVPEFFVRMAKYIIALRFPLRAMQLASILSVTEPGSGSRYQLCHGCQTYAWKPVIQCVRCNRRLQCEHVWCEPKSRQLPLCRTCAQIK